VNQASSSPLKLAVLISGTGRSLRNLIEKIEAGSLPAEIRLVISSTALARGMQYAEMKAIPIEVLDRQDFPSREAYSEAIFQRCREVGADLVVLAGFVRRLIIPDDFTNRVVKSHPSLTPAFAGEGYYGDRVYEAVLEYGVKLTGCTVHFVDNEYDHGPVILQRVIPVHEHDTLTSLEARVFAVECELLPYAIGLIAAGRVKVEGRRVRILPG